MWACSSARMMQLSTDVETDNFEDNTMPATPQQRYPLSFHLCNSLDQSTLNNSTRLEIWVNNQAACSPLARVQDFGSERLAPQTSKLDAESTFAAFRLALNWLCLRTVPLCFECWKVDDPL